MNAEDTRKAVQVAAEAFETYKNTTPAQRQSYLLKLERLMQDSQDDLIRLVVWENGKSWADAKAEVTYATTFMSWFAGEALRTNGETIPCSLPGTRNFTIKQPIGVCALLVPWVHQTSGGSPD